MVSSIIISLILEPSHVMLTMAVVPLCLVCTHPTAVCVVKTNKNNDNIKIFFLFVHSNPM